MVYLVFNVVYYCFSGTIDHLEDQAKFIEKIEIELRGLHEGSIARYRVRPSEYDEWQKNWI